MRNFASMLKLFFVFVSATLLFVSSFGQSDTILLSAKVKELKALSYSNPLEALQHAEPLLAECSQAGYSKGLAEVYNTQGIILYTRGLNDLALQSFINALENFRLLNDTIGMSLVYNNLGVVSYSVKKYYYSIFFFQQSLAIQSRINNIRNVIDLNNNIGSIYEKLKMYNKALSIHRNANAMSIKYGHLVGLSTGLNNIGVIYENSGHPDSAIWYYRKALEVSDSVPISQLALTYSNLGRTLMNNSRIDEARICLDSALLMATNSEATSYLSEIYNLFSQYYDKKGDINKAYKYLLKYKDVNKLIEDQTTEGDFADFILSMQQNKWSKEKKLLDNQVSLQQKVQWLLVIVIVVVIAGFFLVYLNIRNRNRLLDQRHKLSESESLRLADELKNKEIIAQLEKEKLTSELQMKERQLTSMTMHIVTKNETLQEIEKHVEQIASGNPEKSAEMPLNKIKSIIRMNAGDEAVWNNYFYHFEQVYPGFFRQLTNLHPELTQGEQKLCAYITINLNNKEIAHVMGISEASIKIKKNRLSKKLQLDIASDLTSYLRKFTDGE
ncbi:MAG: hypothetical protein CVU11_02180 [Bacteroidetes bacterium HGW-Bacteroidetes-6]|jgi:tetratricopeptide (TPR) repeat protein/DNA-binding CsgD family transcriptional regulator|nr:MAG: hypothetical protein CVU11_02180 [Bacteroidetes bacterium HGW-Bacteroidetes-6]